jgi:hypothetical protein
MRNGKRTRLRAILVGSAFAAAVVAGTGVAAADLESDRSAATPPESVSVEQFLHQFVANSPIAETGSVLECIINGNARDNAGRWCYL